MRHESLTNALATADMPSPVSHHLLKQGFEPGTLTSFGPDDETTQFNLDDMHPAVYLRGLVAPRDTEALVLCFTGTSFSIDGDGRDRQSASVVQTLTSEGQARSFMVSGRAVSHCDEPVGLIPDAMDRVLGLATSPPDFDTSELWLFFWLSQLFRMDEGGDTASILLAHPAIEVDDLPEALDDPVPFVQARHQDLTAVASWDSIFSDAVVGRFLIPGLSIVPYAPWYDLGSFARAVMSEIDEPMLVMSELEPGLCHLARTMAG